MYKTTTAGYSISNQAYNMLNNYSEARYGKDGIAGHVIIDAIRYNLATDDTDAFEKQQYNDVTTDLDGFTFERGETKKVNFRIQEDLLEQFRNQARQVYSQRKIGKYLSRCVHVYIYERKMKAYETVDTSISKIAVELRENYDGLDYIPETEIEIPQSKKYILPLFITLLKQTNTNVYSKAQLGAQAKNELTKYVDISERTINNYVTELSEEHMVEIADVWTGYVIGIEELEGYIFPSETRHVQEYVDEWSNMAIEHMNDGKKAKKVLVQINKCAKNNVDRYAPTDIDISNLKTVLDVSSGKLDNDEYLT